MGWVTYKTREKQKEIQHIGAQTRKDRDYGRGKKKERNLQNILRGDLERS